MSKVIAVAIGVLTLVAAFPALADTTPAQKCVAGKLKAAGKEVARKMACHAKAKAKAVPVDGNCLAKAQAKADAAINKLGVADCAGSAASIDVQVDSCVGAFLGDTPGDGRCPSASAKAAGKAGGALLVCEAREVTKPGTLAACDAKRDDRLGKALTKAGNCASFAPVHTHAHACVDDVKAVVVPPATTSTSSTTTSSTTASTHAPAVCGNGVMEVFFEVCDGDDAVACPGLCLPDCTCPSPVCGNGVIEQGEECEDGSLTGCTAGLYEGCEGCDCCIGEGDTCGFSESHCCGAASCYFTGPSIGICTTTCMTPGGPCNGALPCCGFPCHPNGFCP